MAQRWRYGIASMSSAFSLIRRGSAVCVSGLMLLDGGDSSGGCLCERTGELLNGGAFAVEPWCVQFASDRRAR